MVKKRNTTKKKSAPKKPTAKTSAPAAPQHALPEGFWSQIAAVGLIAFSIVIVVSWFGKGGPVIDWLHQMLFWLLGFASYILPIIFVFIAVKIFQSEGNKVPLVVKIAGVLAVLWVTGIVGIVMAGVANGRPAGGVVGQGLNGGALQLVDAPIAVFLYVLLLSVTIMFMLSKTPREALEGVKGALATKTAAEDEANAALIKQVNAADDAEKAEPKKLSRREKAAQKRAEKAEATGDSPEVTLNGPVQDTAPEKPKRRSGPPMRVERDKQAEAAAALTAVHDANWKAPSLDLLESKQNLPDPGDAQANAKIIRDTYGEFNINVEMESANVGPRVTQYTLKPPTGVKLKRLTALESNIALNLAASSLRIEAPIPGKRAVGIEVPNVRAADVRLYGVLHSKQWRQATEPLTFAVGQDIAGETVTAALNKMPHLLIAGQTGSGKSVMINTLLTSLLYRNSPSHMKLILVDPKQVEMASYQDIPHLLTPIITSPEKTLSALKWAVNEMERRYKLMADLRIRNIKDYNKYISQKKTKITVEDGNNPAADSAAEEGAMPYIVIVIDEMADLMMVAARDVEALVVRIAQKARAVGIHLVLATQRPSVNVITGLIKANVPGRIGFTVASQIDSRTILDVAGAEKLLGQGDMLLLDSGAPGPLRVQGAWVTDDEVNRVCDYLRNQMEPQYNDEIVSQQVQLGKGGMTMDLSGGSDDTYREALQLVINNGGASTSYLQRRLRIGYGKAAALLDRMEDEGIIGPKNGSKPREILVSSIEGLGDD
jgi:putative DNA translocase